MMDWFRWFAGTASDPVFLVIARRSGQPTANVVALWAMLLERANTSVPRGEIRGFDFETADFFLGMPEGSAESIVRALRDKGYLEGERISRQAACRAFCEEEKALARNRETTDPPRRKTETTSVPADMNVTQCHVPSRKVTLEEKRKEKKRREGKIYSCAEQASSAPEKSSADPLEALLEACPRGESPTFPAWLREMLTPEAETAEGWLDECGQARFQAITEPIEPEQRHPDGPRSFREMLSRHDDHAGQPSCGCSDQSVQNLFRQYSAPEAGEAEVKSHFAGDVGRKGQGGEICPESHSGQGGRDASRVTEDVDTDLVVAITQRKQSVVGHFMDSNVVGPGAETCGSVLEQRGQEKSVLPVAQLQRGIALHDGYAGDVVAVAGLQPCSAPCLAHGEGVVSLAKGQSDVAQELKRKAVVAISSTNVASPKRICPDGIVSVPKGQGCVKNSKAGNRVVSTVAPDPVTPNPVREDNGVIARTAENQRAVREIEDEIVPVARIDSLARGVDDNLVGVPVQRVPFGFCHGSIGLIDASCALGAQVKRHDAVGSFVNPHVIPEIKMKLAAVRAGKLHGIQRSPIVGKRKSTDADKRPLRTGCLQRSGGP